MKAETPADGAEILKESNQVLTPYQDGDLKERDEDNPAIFTQLLNKDGKTYWVNNVIGKDRFTKAKKLHDAGRCRKAVLGYNCQGRDGYKECA
jgi:hypothetical protein